VLVLVVEDVAVVVVEVVAVVVVVVLITDFGLNIVPIAFLTVCPIEEAKFAAELPND